MAGSKKGERRGGRQLGVKNKATLEREQRALAELAEKAAAAHKAGKNLKLAKDELAELIPVVKSATAGFQKAAMGEAGEGMPGQKGYSAAKWKEFREWLEFFSTLCYRTADFQSPKYRAIAVAVPPGDPAQPIPERVIEHEPADEHDRERVANASYLKLVKG